MSRTTLAALAVVAIVSASTLIAWSRGASGGPAAAPAHDAGAPGLAPLSGASPVVAAPGRVEALSEEIDVAAEVSGRIAHLLVDEGDRVEEGQVLARLESADHAARVASARAAVAVAEAERLRLVNGARAEERREARAAVDQAEAVLRNAEISLERRRGLAAEGVIAREDLDRAVRDVEVAQGRVRETRERALVVGADARTDERARADATVALARARLAEAQALLDKTVVRAPLGAIVVRRQKQAGESVSVESPQGGLLVTLADTRVLRVRADVDERDVARLSLGQPAYVTADAYGATRFAGRVVRIGEILGRKNVRTDEPTERVDTKVLETLIELEPGARLPLGLRVDAFIGAAAQADPPGVRP